MEVVALLLFGGAAAYAGWQVGWWLGCIVFIVVAFFVFATADDWDITRGVRWGVILGTAGGVLVWVLGTFLAATIAAPPLYFLFAWLTRNRVRYLDRPITPLPTQRHRGEPGWDSHHDHSE